MSWVWDISVNIFVNGFKVIVIMIFGCMIMCYNGWVGSEVRVKCGKKWGCLRVFGGFCFFGVIVLKNVMKC